MPRHAEIVGAGFAGLSAAVSLLQRNWTVRVHERTPSLRNEGFGIAVHENGIRVLEALGVLDQVLKKSMRISRMETRDSLGRTTSVMIPPSRTFRISRQHLVKVLGEEVERRGGEIRTSSPVVAGEPEGTVLLDTGYRLRADLVIGADGYNSSVRDHLGLLRRRVMLDDGAMRLVIPRTADERAREPGLSAPAFENWSGQRRVIINAWTT